MEGEMESGGASNASGELLVIGDQNETRVFENDYCESLRVGVSEDTATHWSDYVEWGVRLFEAFWGFLRQGRICCTSDLDIGQRRWENAAKVNTLSGDP